MFKNVIFDIGRVLINYEPIDYLKSLGFDFDKVNELNNAVFSNPLWNEIDRGTYTIEQAKNILQKDFPHLAPDIEIALQEKLIDILTPKHDSIEFLKQLKKEGYKIYLLSNFGSEAFEIVESRNDFFKLCDGKVISCYINKIKPEKEIYEHLIQTYNITPEQSVFIDDNKQNIEAAKKLLFNTILFTDLKSAKNTFYNFGRASL